MKIKKIEKENANKMSLLEWVITGSLIATGIVVYMADTVGLFDIKAPNNETKSIVETVETKEEPGEVKETVVVNEPITVNVTDVKPAAFYVDAVTGDKHYVAPNGYILDGNMAYKTYNEVISADTVINHK